MKTKASLATTGVTAELEASKEEVESFFKGIVPNFVSEVGGILTDTVKFWRWRNQVRIVQKAEAIIESKGLQKHETSLKLLAPIMEHGAKEDDENMQNRWANLLANAATGNKQVKPNYADILRELSPIEVQILDYLFKETFNEGKMGDTTFTREQLIREHKIEDEIELILEDLMRLNLIRYAPSRKTWGIRWGGLSENLTTVDEVYRGYDGTTTLYNGLDIDSRDERKQENENKKINEKLDELNQKLAEFGFDDRNTIKMTALGFHFVNACKV